jgi:hypothetical protein
MLPRIFFHITFCVEGSDRAGGLEAIAHGLEFIKESFLAGVLDQIESGDLLIACVVELSDLH